jgi:acyl transferase domain-containing protein/NAD(P)H-dependent flavin oxidoreductase YrpB (nitropropane dioxygenase family)/NADP-dependent 3-hydroxy acid dehydrogenase YdfG
MVRPGRRANNADRRSVDRSRSAATFVLNPAGFADPALAIAGSRAGAIGILNAEFGAAASWVEPALARLAEFGGRSIGLKLTAPGAPLLALAAASGNRLKWLVTDLALVRENRHAVAAFRNGGGRIAVEITDWSAELEALLADIDALWLKGHEAGGWVGEQTSFILLQNIVGRTALPLFVRGGINERSAAAVSIGGAAGIVLDDQLLLLRESPLAGELAPKLRHFTGIETILLEQYGTGPALRVWPAPGRSEARELAAAVRQAGGRIEPQHAGQIGWAEGAVGKVPPLGQDGATAVGWAARYGSVAAALRGVATAVATLPARAAELNLCGTDTPLAQSHGTRYPIVQGPMTHVSDRVDFIKAVADGGALPMVAVSLLRGEALTRLLGETKARLGEQPWGVGILGFVPAEILKEQREAVREARPPFAIIAGGRPDQSRELEAAGIHTYLHVPSPALLTQFLEQGARHFIFEGRECGGHIGPLSSFVLWGQMADALIGSDLSDAERRKIHVLFAGGIHDARSSAMAAVMAVPLAEHGIRSGILMGTGYTFTAEAVAGSAITAEFQRVVVAAGQTVGLVTGPGHASRCAVTPFVEAFWQRRRELEQAGVAAEDIRSELEDLSLGRLRLASKGVLRKQADRSGLRDASVAEQRDGGMFMIGQACILRDAPITVGALHQAVGEEAAEWLAASAEAVSPARARPAPAPADIAIVGVSAILPGANDVREYWHNILAKKCAIAEIPPDRWDWRLYYDADRNAPDKIYSKWGGFIPDVPFDPTRFGMPPVSVRAIDPMQLLALVAVEAALDDAGMAKLCAEQRELTSVIFGISGGLGEMGLQYGARTELGRAMGEAPDETLDFLPQWSSDSFAGLLPNVAAGRVANRFDFGGVNLTVDAACASSLAALRLAIIELEAKRCDTVVCGGIDTVQGPFGFTCFSKAQALSPTGRCRTFDAAADGIAISEGIAMVVLKRLADAERDGDRIYAVVKGVGGSSDGRARGLMAPLPAGQKRALARAYAQAGYSPATVELFEAHGTGTVAGDAAEIESLTTFLAEHEARPRNSAVGSVKTMIGHTKATAGIAGLLKAAFALHHRVLPPHLGVEEPNAALGRPDSPLGLHQQPRPWLAHPEHPRRAGVSSFGFGGTNFHVTLEEYRREYRRGLCPPTLVEWPAELLVWRGADREALIARAAAVLAALEAGAEPPLPGIAAALADALGDGPATLAIVASSAAVVRERLAAALTALRTPGDGSPALPAGVYFSDRPLAADGKIAMLFSGQGSQYPDMLRELAVTFPEVREAIEAADAVLSDTPTYRDRDDRRLSRLIYPFDRFSDAEEKAARAALASTDVAQPALGAVETGLLTLVDRLGLRADMVGGHSYGEYVALHAAGVLSRRELLLASEARGRFIIGATRNGDLGTMAAVAADSETVRGALGDCPEIVVANLNSPKQTVISGARPGVAAAIERLGKAGLAATPIPVAAAFHSPLMKPAQEPLIDFFGTLKWSAPRFPVYANTTAAPHDAAPERVRGLLGRHLTEPVDFLGMIEAMYADGARLFVEIGPKSVLADLTRRILDPRPHRAVSFDSTGGGLLGMLHALAALIVEGAPVRLERLFDGRVAEPIDLAKLPTYRGAEVIGPNTWLVNGTRARRVGEDFAVSAKRRAALPSPETTPAMAEPAPPAIPPAPKSQSISPPAWNGAANVAETYHNRRDGPSAINGTPINGRPAAGLPEVAGPTPYPATGADRTMAEYYQTMRQFLQVQERLMLAYLGAADTAPRPFAAPQPALNWGVGAPIAAAPVVAAPAFEAAAAAPAPQPIAAPPRTHQPPPPAAPAPIQAKSAEATNGSLRAQPVSVPAASAPPPAAAAAPAVDPKTLLLEVVSDRTGYPQDMLGLDLNMEADLGIDSIKRVEILGAFRKMLPASVGDELSTRMDDLSKAKSLQGILDLVAATKAAPGETQRPFEVAGRGQEQASATPSRLEALSAPLARYVIRSHPEPLPADRPAAVPAGMYVIVPDRLGVAEVLVRRLELDGARVRVMPDSALASDDAVGKWLGTVRAEDRIRGLIDLRPVRRPAEGELSDAAAWRQGMENDVKALFPVLRFAASDLLDAGCVLVGSGMGGHFGRDVLDNPDRQRFFPGSGGGVGLIKCLSLEWTGSRCKAIDLDLDEPAERLGEHLHAELAFPGGRREAGYPKGVRTIFRTEVASLMPRAEPIAKPGEDWVVVAIGGARGITAETLREFAAARCTCVIVGRSALPGPQDAATAGLQDAPALRAHFVARAKESGERPKPAEIEARISSLLRDLETRANLDDFAALGARIDYRVCDVRQEAEVVALMQSLYDRYGRIDAVLFGAGLIEDQLLVNKTAESLARVFDTKVDGAFQLARQLRPDSLKFVAFFTSVAGRYGNRGQTDYGAANEVLNRFAWMLQAQWGERVKVSAINWGPWARTTRGPGMLTPETARQFRARGVSLIEPAEGSGFLIRELLYAPRDEVEVVAGEHPYEYREAAASGMGEAATAPAQPLLPAGTAPVANGKGPKLRKTIDLVSDPYLDEHRIDGRPVLPFAGAAEYMAEAAALLSGGKPVRALTGMRMLNGFVMREAAVETELLMEPGADGGSALMTLGAATGNRRPYYRATAEFGPAAPPRPSRLFDPARAPAPLDIGDVYRRWLFHGPLFQTVREISVMSREWVVAKAVATDPLAFYPPAEGLPWMFDPGLVDGALQLVFVWARWYREFACLPAAVGRLERYGDEPLIGEFTIAMEMLAGWTDSYIRARFEIIDAEGRVRISVDDLDGYMTPDLVRVGGGWAGGIPAGMEV